MTLFIPNAKAFTAFFFTYVVATSLSLTSGTESNNYATITASAHYEFFSMSIGTFSFSLDRCQSFRGSFYSTSFDAGVILSCLSNGENGVNITYFKDIESCNNNILSDIKASAILRVNETIKASEDSSSSSNSYAKITLDSLKCNSINSGNVDFVFANNCSWQHSSNPYLNVSIPPNVCLTLNGDFSGILTSLPSVFLPDTVVSSLKDGSYQYSCCKSNNDLLVYNFSDTACENEVNVVRIGTEWKNKCLEVSNEKFVGSWTCSEYVDCDSMGYTQTYDVSKYYSECADTCYGSTSISASTMTPDSTEFETTQSVTETHLSTQAIMSTLNFATSYETSETLETLTPSSMPTVAIGTIASSTNFIATEIPTQRVTDIIETIGVSTESPLEATTGKITLSKEQIIGMCVAALLLCVICTMCLYFKRRRSKMSRAVRKQNEKMSKDKRYAPILEDEEAQHASNYSDDIINVEPSQTENGTPIVDPITTATVIMDTTNDIAEITYDIDTNGSGSKKSKKIKKDQLLR